MKLLYRKPNMVMKSEIEIRNIPKLRKFFGDPAAYIDLFIREFRLNGYQYLSTAFSRLLFHWKGVQLGSRCRFIGIPLVTRAPYSKIRLGDDCFLRSDSTS